MSPSNPSLREKSGRGNGKIMRNDNDGRHQGDMALEIQKDWQSNELTKAVTAVTGLTQD